MSIKQCQQLYELRKKVRLVKGKKTSESGIALEARVTLQKAKTESSTDGSFFPEKKSKATNSNNAALDRKQNCTRQSSADTPLKGQSA